jgi:glycosyltransferase involved in cell wall biosynthesis
MVSVVMSVYNGQTYLHEAIDSILNQSYTDFEFIIINDGSSDRSLSIIQSYQDKRIIFIDNDGNKGLIYSLNKGIEIAKGKYIARMDADDISLSNRFLEQIIFLESNENVGVLGCNYIQFNEKSLIEYKSIQSHDEILSYMLFNSSVVHPSLMIRKSILDLQPIIFDPAYKHAEDYELWSRLIFKTKFCNLNRTLFKYRIHKSQITSFYSKEQLESANNIRYNILKYAGFVFNEIELTAHRKIGSSQLLKDFNALVAAEKWLVHLLNQNETIQKIDKLVFRKVISKQWIDTCGNTSLGLKAFFYYLKSDLSKINPENKVKLLVKCIIRKFKK